ncbi:MAG: helix-turn-helix domain-containing protein [Candidatus Xenobium sp.]|jgi:transcriptional regulator with XRE-family HTH domain|nr:helix-turn-helix domain-containing protein [Burkholderiales bacterium]
MTDNSPLPQRLRTTRENRRLSREALAALAGISSRSIVRYEAGEQTPKASTTVKLAHHLGVSVAFLTGKTDDPYVDSSIRIEEYSSIRPKRAKKRVNLLEVAALLVEMDPQEFKAVLDIARFEKSRMELWESLDGSFPDSFGEVFVDLAHEKVHRDAQLEKGMAMLEEDARNRAQGPQ